MTGRLIKIVVYSFLIGCIIALWATFHVPRAGESEFKDLPEYQEYIKKK